MPCLFRVDTFIGCVFYWFGWSNTFLAIPQQLRQPIHFPRNSRTTLDCRISFRIFHFCHLKINLVEYSEHFVILKFVSIWFFGFAIRKTRANRIWQKRRLIWVPVHMPYRCHCFAITEIVFAPNWRQIRQWMHQRTCYYKAAIPFHSTTPIRIMCSDRYISYRLLNCNAVKLM